MLVPDRWLWLGGSILAALLAAGAAWFWRSRALAEDLAASPFFAPLLQAFRFLYYVGGPFAALIWGRDAVVERLLGLGPLPYLLGTPLSPDEKTALWMDGMRGVGWVIFLGTSAWATLAVIWWATRYPGQEGLDHLPRSPLLALREAFFQETHWMFYRNAPVVALGTYWGTWVGLIPLLLEAGLNPWWRAALRDSGKRPAMLIRAGMAVLSAAFYLRAASLWLAILLHWGVTWGVARWAASLACRRMVRPTDQICSK